MGEGYGIWIVVGIVVFTIAQVFWVLPGPRARGLARLREHAYTLGLRPEQRSLPDGLRRLGLTGDAMKYRTNRPIPGWPRKGPVWIAVIPATETDQHPVWASKETGPDMLLDILARHASTGVTVVELDSGGAGFYWGERGEADVVDALAGMLTEFTDAYVAATPKKGGL